MMFMESNLSAELSAAEAMAAELNDYLYRGELFRQMLVHTADGDLMPKMTLGGLLERLQDLRVHWHDLTPDQQSRLEAVEDALKAAWRRHREPFTNMIRREFKSYLHSWKWYLENLQESPQKEAYNYAAEVHNRRRLTILEQSAAEWGIDLGPDQQQLAKLDGNLRHRWQQHDYIGRQGEEQFHDPEKEWYLFGRPRIE